VSPVVRLRPASLKRVTAGLVDHLCETDAHRWSLNHPIRLVQQQLPTESVRLGM